MTWKESWADIICFFSGAFHISWGAGWLSGLELEPDLSFRLLSTNRLFAVTTNLSIRSDDPVTIVTSRSDDLMSTHCIVHFTNWDTQIPISSVYGCWKPSSFDDTFSHYILCLMQGCGEEARQIYQQWFGMKVVGDVCIDSLLGLRGRSIFSGYLTNCL